MNSDNVVIRVENLEKSFGRNHVLRGISTEIHKGEVVVIEESFGVRVTEIIKN